MKLSQLKKRRPSKDPLLLRIDSYLEAKYNQPLNYEQKPAHTPSGLGTSCYRKIYYQYFRVEKDSKIDAGGAKIFSTGDAYEAMIMDWLKGIGEHIPYLNKGDGQIPKNRRTGLPDPQFPISLKDYRLNKGFIDNVALVDDKLWLYEIKSSNSYKFGSLEEPIAEHIDQVSLYFKAVNEHLNNGDYSHIPQLKGISEVEGIKIIYINKDTSALKIFTLTEKDVRLNLTFLLKKIEKANNYADLKELPPKTEDNCKWCPYSKKCSLNWNKV